MSVRIICIHGCLGSRQEFAPLVRRLHRHGIKATCLPLLGHPGHPAGLPFHQLTGPQLVADMQQQLSQLGAGPFILVGHSLGGLLSLGMAAAMVNNEESVNPDTPEIIGVATLGAPYDTAWTVNQPMGWAYRRSVGHLVKALRYLPDTMRTISDPLGGMRSLRNYPAMRQETEWLFSWLQHQLPYVTVPVWLCHGHYDLTVPREARTAIASQLTHCPDVVMSDITQCGHQIFPKSRAAPHVMQELLWFIDKVRQQRISATDETVY
jgi:pimeloyl-ACP methyl ester carboxylesterase